MCNPSVMNIQQIQIHNLKLHEALFSICFPKARLTSNYLEWLYFSNPLGNVVGFDAFCEKELIAHCAFIPTRIGDTVGLLSLNVATHPNHQSQGIFQKLVQLTFETWDKDFGFVVAVANAQSARTFIKRLGFQEIGRLNLRFGKLQRPINGVRTWTKDDIDWRVKSPRGELQANAIGQGFVEMSIRPEKFPFKLKALVPVEYKTGSPAIEFETKKRYGFTVDWIKNTKPLLHLPTRLKPSPLVMIYRSLNGNDIVLNSWSFPDFDAF